MKKTNLFMLASLFMLAAAAGLMTACSTDDDPVDNGEVIAEIPEDVAQGALFRIIHADSLYKHKVPLAKFDDIEVTPANNEYYGAEIIEENGTKYVVPVQKKAQDKPLVCVRTKIIPKSNPNLGRNVFLVFYNPAALPQSARTRATDTNGKEKVYERYIGGSVYYFGKPGATVNTIISYDKVKTFGDTLMREDNPTPKEFHVEYSGSSFEETAHSFSVNIGLSSKKTRQKGLNLANVVNRVLNVTPSTSGDESGFLNALNWAMGGGTRAETVVKSRALDFGISGNFDTSESFEYYINMYRAQLSDVHMTMSRFETDGNGHVPDVQLLWAITNPAFCSAIANVRDTTAAGFSAANFYDTWGTDIITQARFGGGYYYIYGRKENTYEQTVDIDAMASFRKSYPNTDVMNNGNTGDWVKIFQAKNADYVSREISATYNNSHYSEASKAQTYELSLGGDLHKADDVATWMKGFDDPENWDLLSYHVGSDITPADGSEGGPYLYPIDQYIQNMAIGYYLSLDKDSILPSDEETAKKWLAVANRLAEKRSEYIAEKASKIYPRTRLVVADFMMVKSDDGHRKDDPKTLIRFDDKDQQYRIYYPMMVNQFQTEDERNWGYALETSGSPYNVIGNDADHYWYYSLAYEEDCTGLTDVDFAHNKPSDDYFKRGDDSYHGEMGIYPNPRYTWVKYFNSKRDDPSRKITAIGLTVDEKVDHVFSSTGGSELHPMSDSYDKAEWLEGWRQNADRSHIKHKWNDGGWWTQNWKFAPIMRRDTLPIRNIKNIVHPKKWEKNRQNY